MIFSIYVSLASIEKFISFLEYFYLSEADVGVNVVFIGVRRLPLEWHLLWKWNSPHFSNKTPRWQEINLMLAIITLHHGGKLRRNIILGRWEVKFEFQK